MNKDFIFAVASLIGAIVGLGIFGIPYVAARAGFFIGVGYIVGISAVMTLLHLMIGEIVERTKETHRLTGYIGKYLGAQWKKHTGIAIILSAYAALLAYIIVGGKFLSLLFPNILTPFLWGLIFWIILSALVLAGIRTIAKIELIMASLLILFVFMLLGWGRGSIQLQNFSGFHVSDFFLPYGVVLFAIDGSFAIPEIRAFFSQDGSRYKRAILAGTLISALLFLLFAFAVVGISGDTTSKESLEGLIPFVGGGITTFGALFGILAIASSYLLIGVNIKNTLTYDWRMNSYFAGILATLAPITLFFMGAQDFTGIISFSATIFWAIMGVIIVLVYKKALRFGDRKPGYALHVPKLVLWGLMVLLALAGVYEIIYQLANF